MSDVYPQQIKPLPWAACERVGDTNSSDRPAWLAARSLGIGASEAAAALGLSEYRHPLSVYAAKVLPPVDGGGFTSNQAYWGNKWERDVLEEYAKLSGRVLLGLGGVLLRSREHPFLICTLDETQAADVPVDARPGWESEYSGLVVPVEAKTTGHGYRYENGEPPVEVSVQVQHHLIVTGAPWETVAWLDRMTCELRWCDVQAHPEFQAYLVEELAAFWKRVQDRNPPDADGSWSARAALRRLHPRDDGTSVVLGDEWLERTAEYHRLSAEKSAIESKLDAIRAQLAETLGPATYGDLADGSHWSYRAQTKTLYTCEKCQNAPKSEAFRVPRWTESKGAREKRIRSGGAAPPALPGSGANEADAGQDGSA